MSLPRNHETHPENRQSVGGYLYGKLGRLGLLAHMHTFQVGPCKSIFPAEWLV